MPVRRFRLKHPEIEAMQYTAERCRELHEWIGVPHNDGGGCGDDELVFVSPNDSVVFGVEPGEWVVKNSYGGFYVLTDAELAEFYEPIEENANA